MTRWRFWRSCTVLALAALAASVALGPAEAQA